MHPEIESRFDKLEERRTALTERVRMLPAAKQTAQPAPKEFSPAEVIMHMALAETYDLKKMEKELDLSGKCPKPTFFYRNAIKNMAAAKRMPTFGAMTPKSAVNLDAPDKAWAEVREKQKKYFDRIADPGDPMIKHPFFGLLSAADVLTLLEAHAHYHETRLPAV